MSRKKKLRKGIASLKNQVGKHLEKLRAAEEEGAWELAEYYHKEIKKFEQEIAKKKRQLEKR
jgi:peptidoglycan hydrolase CwlO-like protein